MVAIHMVVKVPFALEIYDFIKLRGILYSLLTIGLN